MAGWDGEGFRTALPVSGRPVLVVGGTAAALGPIAGLLAAGALVTVVAESASDSVADLAARDLLTWHRRGVQSTDLEATWLVVAAGGDPAADAAIIDAATAAGRFCLPAAPAPDSGETAPGPRPGKAVSGATPPVSPGQVVLVGGGPGDPGLLTVAGLAAVRSADVLLVDRLAPLAVLQETKTGAEVIDVAKIPRGRFTAQQEINRLLIDRARRGRTVVRLKGGDNFVFGRGGEEWQACVAAGIEVRVIPGVSAALAAPALAGIPVTHRSLTQGFTVVTGHLPPGDPGSTLDWAALATAGTTLIIMMGVRHLPAITAELLARGMDPATAAATVADAGLRDQRSVRAPLADIARVTAEAGLVAPAVTVIGAVAAFDPHADQA